MAQKILFFDNQIGTNLAFADTLSFHGYQIIKANDLGTAEKIVADADFFALVYGAQDASTWQICQTLLIKNPQMPVIYIMTPDYPR